MPTENLVFDLLQAETECPNFHAHLPSLSPSSPGPLFSVMRSQSLPDSDLLLGTWLAAWLFPITCSMRAEQGVRAAALVLKNTLQTQAAVFLIRICLACLLQAIMCYTREVTNVGLATTEVNVKIHTHSCLWVNKYNPLHLDKSRTALMATRGDFWECEA